MIRRSSVIAKIEPLVPVFFMDSIRRCFAFCKWVPYQAISFSQEGEDMILNRIFELQSTGFYVDVGAHHPQRFSNTYFFYRRGWRGINIDAMPGSMRLFNKIRTRDINIEIAVMRQKGKVTYYQFNEPALNGFSKDLSDSRDGLNNYKIIGTIDIEGKPLSEIIDNYIPINTEIDFLSVDVEGLDLDVLESNDWSRYRPKVVLVEVLTSSLSTIQSNPIYKFMENNQYQIYAKAVNTVFFLSEEYIEAKASK
jgi:FkbM family methyltransferase